MVFEAVSSVFEAVLSSFLSVSRHGARKRTKTDRNGSNSADTGSESRLTVS